MTTLLSNTIQPPLLTLLSSTSQPGLSPLFTRHVDPTDPNNSFITLIPDHLAEPASSSSGSKRRTFDHHYLPQTPHTGGHVVGQVIHIQSPNPTRTFIQAGSSKGKGRSTEEAGPPPVLPLGIELPWVGIQIKRLGQKGLAFEFGVVDARGKEGTIRLSSYKAKPSSHPDRSPPLIHLPLDLPAVDKHTLTPWLEIKLNLAILMPLFKTLPRSQIHNNDDVQRRKRSRPNDELPSDQFSHVAYVRVYANCRLRRIWFSEDGERTVEQAGVKEEWALFAHPAKA